MGCDGLIDALAVSLLASTSAAFDRIPGGSGSPVVFRNCHEPMLTDLESTNTENLSLRCYGPVTDVLAQLRNGNSYGWSSDCFHYRYKEVR